MFVTISLSSFGPIIIRVVYGQEYTATNFVVTSLSTLAGAKIVRSWAVAAALSTGKTKDILLANILRLAGFALALAAAAHGLGTGGVAFGMSVGEFIAAGFALIMADRYGSPPMDIGRQLYAAFFTVGASAVILSLVWPATSGSILLGLVLDACLVFVGAAGVLYVSPQMRLNAKFWLGKPAEAR
jgi:O-antigen/teichoic acid export membrane protein